MSKKKYKDTYVSEFYNVEETIEILKKCSADIRFKVYHKIRKELVPSSETTMNDKTTLSKRIDQLTERMDQLAKIVQDGFKQVNSRLDYIVKANNLKVAV